MDGSIHDLQRAYDEGRTKKLKELGYQELRFLNDEVEINISRVLERIHKRCATYRTPSLPLGKGKGAFEEGGQGRDNGL